jgi:DNA processing protein
LPSILALSLVAKLSSSEVITLAQRYATLDDALASIGRHPMDLEDQAAGVMDRCAAQGVDIITALDERYPVRLRSLDRRPAILYVRGVMPQEFAPSIAVVGTRSCSVHYGKVITDHFVDAWSSAGAVIVSGLANGIDTIAHEAAVRARGRTVAVIASGIDRITPRAAMRLADRIVEANGCIVSEHPCGVAALPPYFPARNRIISGMSDAVVVMESKAKGGALITADFAVDQGRPLYAVPGPVTSDRSAGCHALIRSGKAHLLQAPEQVLAADAVEADPATTRIVTADEMAAAWGCSVADALVRLFEGELDGSARCLPGGRYLLRGDRALSCTDVHPLP